MTDDRLERFTLPLFHCAAMLLVSEAGCAPLEHEDPAARAAPIDDEIEAVAVRVAGRLRDRRCCPRGKPVLSAGHRPLPQHSLRHLARIVENKRERTDRSRVQPLKTWGTVNGHEFARTQVWRKGWDSNPRRTFTRGGFQDRCLKPLGHPSFAPSFATSIPRRRSARAARKIADLAVSIQSAQETLPWHMR
jgi:hypothetical protein